MTFILVLLGLLVGSGVFWWGGRWMRRRLPFTHTSYHPAQGLPRQLVSQKYGITGKPDLIIEQGDYLIPVLVKSGRANTSPHESHIAQIAVHCLLIEDVAGQAPPYGIIRYDNRTFEIDYDDEIYEMLIELLDEMHNEREYFAEEMDRSHDITQRCFACRHRKRCPQSLATP